MGHGRWRPFRFALLASAPVLFAAFCLGGCAADDRAQECPTRLVILAVDAGTWNVLTPMINQGELPTIAGLLEGGSYGILESGEPIQSPQMWTSIATGKVPEKHGITGFTARIPGGDKEVPVTSNLRKAKAFWNILSENGISVGVVGWWPSWPAEEVNGFIIAQRAWPVNWSRHGIPFGAARDERGALLVQAFPGRTFPESLYDEFEQFIITEEDVTREELDLFFADSRFTEPARQFYARWVYAKDKTFADAGLHFLTKLAPEVFAVYLQGTDVVAHYYWGYQTGEGFRVSPADARMYGDVVRNYYKMVDKIAADLIDAVSEDTAVLIVSDHGFETKMDLKKRWERGEHIRTKEGGKDVPWDHALDGIFIMSGPGIRQNHRIENNSVVDVLPTMLAYLDLPTARDMDGGVIEEVFEPHFLSQHPVRYVDTYETGDTDEDAVPLESPMDEGIREKLRSLGYIE